MTMERRALVRPLDVREQDEHRTVGGYAAVFGAAADIAGQFREILAPGAFSDTIGGDVRALIDHDSGRVIGRTTAGTLRPAPAYAADDCVLDNCEDRRPPVATSNDPRAHAGVFTRRSQGPTGPSRSGSFDFWVLSLSWSPGFCATGGDEKGRDQCRAGADIGFTVHGQLAGGPPDGPIHNLFFTVDAMLLWM